MASPVDRSRHGRASTRGAKRLTRFQHGADGELVREEVAGNGMYEGLVTTGTVKEVVPTTEIQPGLTPSSRRRLRQRQPTGTAAKGGSWPRRDLHSTTRSRLLDS